jgi:molecular chaperone GrpE
MAEEEKTTVEQDTPETEQEVQEAQESENTEAEASEAQETGDAAEEGAPQEKGEKKSPFKKKEKKKDKKDERIEELTDQVKRQMAEFENFRKRTEKEKSQMYEVGAKSIIEKILPVVDNFERGLAAVPEDQTSDPFVDGMDKIYKQMMNVLTELGVTPIEAVGKEFDPEYHNAVMQVESEEYESGIIAQELQKGYMYRDGVVRHSMVAVVQ